jgi:hypothetical protein
MMFTVTDFSNIYLVCRVSTFSHDLIPNYLRTRPDPELELRHSSLEMRANSTALDQHTKQGWQAQT